MAKLRQLTCADPNLGCAFAGLLSPTIALTVAWYVVACILASDSTDPATGSRPDVQRTHGELYAHKSVGQVNKRIRE